MDDFAPAEYRRRVAALQAEMAAQEMDALLLTQPADVFYVTGFLTRFWESPARPWYVVVPAAAPPVAVIPAIGADLMRRGWMTDIRTWDAPRPADEGVSLLADALCQAVPPAGRLGVPMGAETHLRAPLADWAEVQRRIAPRKAVDATDAVRRVREVKSEPEIARIRAACLAADAAYAAVPSFARAGVPLVQVFRDFQVALLQGGADWVSYAAGGAGPGGYGDVISPASGRSLAPGDVLMLDTGAVVGGYFCDIDRNYSVGPPSATVRRAHAALYRATDFALARVAPGMCANDLHRLLAEGLARHGMQPAAGRLGHGLGLTLTEWPSLLPADATPLRAGMVLTLEPAVELAPGRLMVHEENIVLRDTGAELLSTRAPAEMPVLAG